MKRYLFLTVTLVMFFLLAVNAFATTYYVKSDGNDSNTGLSDVKAWRTINKVNRSVSGTGHDVYFKCGDTWTGQSHLKVDWYGTSGNRVVIGAYYTDGGVEVIGVRGDKPVLNGNHRVPSDPNAALVLLNDRDYVTVENLQIMNSEGVGVRVNWCDNVIVKNVGTDNTRAAGILFYESTNGIAENCTIRLAGMGWKEGLDSDWPLAIGAIGYCDNIIIRKCLIYETYSEGIGFYGWADNCIAENNIIYDALKYGIYLDAVKGTIIRNNIIYGTTDTKFHRVGKFAGTGIGVTDELRVPARSENNKFYGNLVANCFCGIRLGCNNKDLKDTIVYNNTLVDNGTAISVYAYPPKGGFSNSFIRNNIFWQPSGGALHDVRRATPGLTWSHNNWGANPGNYVSGTGDVIGNPLLSKTTGWQSLTSRSLNGSDFALKPNSPARNAGTPLGAEFDDIPECNRSVWPTQVVLMDQDNQGSRWEIGADIYVANPTVLDAPTGLKIVSALEQ